MIDFQQVNGSIELKYDSFKFTENLFSLPVFVVRNPREKVDYNIFSYTYKLSSICNKSSNIFYIKPVGDELYFIPDLINRDRNTLYKQAVYFDKDYSEDKPKSIAHILNTLLNDVESGFSSKNFFRFADKIDYDIANTNVENHKLYFNGTNRYIKAKGKSMLAEIYQLLYKNGYGMKKATGLNTMKVVDICGSLYSDDNSNTFDVQYRNMHPEITFYLSAVDYSNREFDDSSFANPFVNTYSDATKDMMKIQVEEANNKYSYKDLNKITRSQFARFVMHDLQRNLLCCTYNIPVTDNINLSDIITELCTSLGKKLNLSNFAFYGSDIISKNNLISIIEKVSIEFIKGNSGGSSQDKLTVKIYAGCTSIIPQDNSNVAGDAS